MAPDQIKTKEWVDKLEQVVKDMMLEEKKKQKAIIELEKVVKAMSRKVIYLELLLRPNQYSLRRINSSVKNVSISAKKNQH